MTAFTLDTTVATPSETTVVTTPTRDTSPDVVITTAEAGTIVVAGTTGCGVGSAAVSSGQQTITLSTITQGDGSYTCTITFTDSVGNAAAALTMTAFVLDTTAPAVTVSHVAGTGSYVNSAEYAAGFNIIGTTTAEDGQTVTVVYGVGAGAATATCSVSSSAYTCGLSNTVLEATNSDNGISDGTLTVTADVDDAAGNSATKASVFAVQDTSVPSVSETTAVDAADDGISKDNTPNVVITSSQAGDLSYSGCTIDSATASTISASSATTLTLDADGNGAGLSDGTFANCVITVTDAAGNGGTVTLTTFVIDTTVATPSETTAVTTPTNDASPNVVITTAEAGTIVVAGTTGCGVGSAAVSSGQQTITLSTITQGDGAYTCTITFTDTAGNAANALTMTAFTLDTAVATPSETTVVTTPTKDTTPDVVITTTQAGTIAVGGTSGCGVGSANVISGQQTVTLSASGGDKAYTCTITFTDSAGNTASALTLTAFTLDTTAATPSETTAVTTPTKDTSPDVVITTSEAGTIVVAGTTGCGVGSANVASGQQTITLSTITQGDGAYTCTITFSDALGNAASALTMTAFTLDTTVATPSETTVVTTPTKDTTPDVVITTAEAGTIAVGGTAGCGVGSSSVSSGQQTVTLSASSTDKAYTCTITFTDAAGNVANALTLTAFTLDTTVATPSETTVVTTPTKDTTPSVVITTAEAGTIVVGGTTGCAVGSANVVSGQQTITYSTITQGDGTYTCTMTFTDSVGNAASALTLTAFVLDTTVATPSETTAVSTPTNDETPDVVITTAEAGTIVVAGTTGCGVASAAVSSGEQTITLSEITQGDGAYTCTITFTDAAGNAANALTLTAFTLDNAVATPSETTVVTTPTKDTTPDVVITTTQAGTIAVGGTTGCGVGSSAVSSGQQTVTLSASGGDKAYTCTITFTDSAGNTAAALTLTAFTLDTTVATPSETTVVTTPTKDTTPSVSVVITTAEAGTIVVGGTTGCAVGSANVVSGQQTITFSTITQGDGAYTCTITFTDSAGNAASALTLTAFTLDTTAATPSETTAVTTPTKDTSPDVVITTSEAGTIAVGGTTGCGVGSSSVSSGQQTITLSTITQGDGAYTCTITFSDALGNAASALTMTAFTLDTTVAAPSETTAVTTPTKDTSPDVVITTSEAGTIAVGGTTGCGVGSSSVSSGQQTITLSTITQGDGAYTCTITFTDAAGNAASAITMTAFTLDTTVAAPSETTAVTTPTKDTSPDVVITTSEAGTIAVGGTTGCGVGSSSVSSGQQTITLSTITQGDGAYTCTITFTDAAGNAASALTMTAFTLDTTVAAPSETTAVTTPTKDTSPDVVITTSEAGTIAVGGTTGCGVGSSSVSSGQQTITLSTITQGDGAYTCTITFTDAAGNAASALTMTAFTLDTTVAAPSETTAVTTPTKDTSPDVVITTSEAGTIAVGGTTGCGVGSSSVSSGQQTITLSTITQGDGAYTCTITFTDAAGNAASAITMTAFTLDTTAATPSETTAVTTPTKDTSPDVVITTSEAGTIAVGGTTGCGVGSSSVSSGQQTITLSTITQGDGAYTCTITFSDALGNAASALTMTAFTLDTTVAAPSETTAVTTPTKDTSPDVVITTSEAGTIAVGGTTGCGVGSSSVSSGQQTITLSTITQGDGAYTCTITFTDAAGNAASAITMTAFTLDTTVAAPSETTAVTTPTKDTSPDVV
ncbi:MAG: beta strand repeat-containing protein, partial [Candidatus Thalassarchaeaceae archaeon]